MSVNETKKEIFPAQHSKSSIEWKDVPLKYQSALSLVLIFFAALLLLPSPEVEKNAPIFQSAREENGQHFGANRLEEAPILYGLAHGAMGALWSVCIPLQHIKAIRQKYPVVHRYSGRLAILASFSLGISGMLFSPLKLAYTAPLFHIHRLRIGSGNQKLTVLAWPSFESGIWILGGIFLILSILTIRSARAKRYEEHKKWAKILTLTGYVVPLQRVLMLFLNILGFGILPKLSKHQKEFFNCPDTLSVSAKSAAEKAGFAWTTWAAAVVMITYTIRIKQVKKNIASNLKVF